jgi:D-alanyl-D-alanine carboxypeptidase
MKGKLTSANSLAKMKELNQGYGRGLFQYPCHEKDAYGHTSYISEDEIAFTLLSSSMNISIKDQHC